MKFANATKLHRKSGEASPFSFPVSRCGPEVKASEKGHVHPCTRKFANMAHPSRGQGLVANRKSRGRKTFSKLEGEVMKRRAFLRSLAATAIAGMCHR